MNKLFCKSFLFINFLLFFSFYSFQVQSQLLEDPLQNLDSYIEQVRQDWDVPGVAIAIVKDGSVVWAKGYGVTQVGEGDPVNEETLFAIGSCTKAFTSTALALLIEENQLSLDDYVTDYLSDFKLFDPAVTEQLTIRDLLSHRTGLTRADLLWYGTEYSRQEVLHRLRYLKPTWDFRSQYGYQNIMFLAAGEVIPSLLGKSWDEFTYERLFHPLGMKRTTTSIKDFEKLTNVASPHVKINQEVKSVPWRNIDNIGPAASINSNAIEMAQWIKFHLKKGQNNNQQLIDPKLIEMMYQAQIDVPCSNQAEYPMTSGVSYGLGWFLHDYKGHQVVEHGGAIDGMSALVTMIPEEKLGIVILTNMEYSWLPRVLKYEIFDRYLDYLSVDWNAYFKNELEQMQASHVCVKQPSSTGTLSTLDLKEYVGTYEDELYGQVKISLHEEELTIDFLAFKGKITHWDADSFEFDPSQSAPTQLNKWLITFLVNQEGAVEELKISEPSLKELVFKKVSSFKLASD